MQAAIEGAFWHIAAQLFVVWLVLKFARDSIDAWQARNNLVRRHDFRDWAMAMGLIAVVGLIAYKMGAFK